MTPTPEDVEDAKKLEAELDYETFDSAFRTEILSCAIARIRSEAEARGRRLGRAEGCEECGYVPCAPVENCGHQDKDDGTCHYPGVMTPECHTHCCPLLSDDRAAAERAKKP